MLVFRDTYFFGAGFVEDFLSQFSERLFDVFAISAVGVVVFLCGLLLFYSRAPSSEHAPRTGVWLCRRGHSSPR